MEVQTFICGVLIDVEACEAVREVKKVEGRGRVCTPALSTFQQVCLLLHVIYTCATSF